MARRRHSPQRQQIEAIAASFPIIPDRAEAERFARAAIDVQLSGRRQ